MNAHLDKCRFLANQNGTILHVKMHPLWKAKGAHFACQNGCILTRKTYAFCQTVEAMAAGCCQAVRRLQVSRANPDMSDSPYSRSVVRPKKKRQGTEAASSLVVVDLVHTSSHPSTLCLLRAPSPWAGESIPFGETQHPERMPVISPRSAQRHLGRKM